MHCAFLLIGLGVLLILLDRAAAWHCREHYNREVAYWQQFEVQRKRNLAGMGRRWARLDHASDCPQGLPRGTDRLTVEAYLKELDRLRKESA